MTTHFTAWIALSCWPVVAAILYHKCSLEIATAATLLCGYLLLPELIEIDLPVLPPFNKDSIPAFSALCFVWLASLKPQPTKGMLPGWLPRDKTALTLMIFLIIGAFGSTLSNLDEVQNAGRWLPGMRLYDGFSISLSLFVMLTPFLIARKVMATYESQRRLAIFFVATAVAYGVLALWEVRMSPQLNRQIYGFFAHSWNQHERGGGFRPILFLEHGLLIGIYMACAVLTAIGLARSETGRTRVVFAAATVWLLLVIMFSKVLGALSIVILLMPVLLFCSLRLQLFIVLGLGVVVMSYPILRTLDLVPTQQLLIWAENINPARAESLAYRFRNEDALLEHARERPIFGWGGWTRNRIFNEAGEDISVIDGRWIFLFGTGGWVRYIAEFGLLLLGSFRMAFMPRNKIDPILVTLSVALIANLIDLLPNSGDTAITWMIAGAMIGRLENGAETLTSPEASADTHLVRRQYARNLGPQKIREGLVHKRNHTPPRHMPLPVEQKPDPESYT